jgi:predicted enzyme related to lactoylglutathione lyase
MTWSHSLNWFEIPARDLNRAYTFYSVVLGGHVRRGTFGNGELILFDVPFSTGAAVGGSIVLEEEPAPAGGTLVYLNTFGDIEGCLSRVESAGGEVLVPKTDLGPFGFSAVIRDSEGNRIGLHQNTRF